jgi:ADP-heptose:LPS heptosyltransferase
MQLKQLERAWRRRWIGLLSWALARGSRGDATAPIRRVLFLRPDRIGDMVMSLGVLRAIANAHRTIELDVLASTANAPAARGQRYIRDILVLDRKHPRSWPATIVRLRRGRYDAVVDCMPTAASVTTLLLMLAVKARERIGVAGRGIDGALTIAVPPRTGARHIIDHLSAVAAAFGVDVAHTDFTPALVVGDDERARATALWDAHARAGMRRLLVNVSAGHPARHWPDERFVELLALVRHKSPDVQPLIVGGPEDAERIATIARVAGAPVARTPSLRDAFALIATADVMLSADTGLAHAATALRTPIVVMHRRGATAMVWGLYGAPGRVVESADETLAGLAAAPVWDALEALLAGLPRPASLGATSSAATGG